MGRRIILSSLLCLVLSRTRYRMNIHSGLFYIHQRSCILSSWRSYILLAVKSGEPPPGSFSPLHIHRVYYLCGLIYCIFILFLFFFSSTTLLLPTHLPPPLCTHAQSCNPMDFSPPDSSVHGLFQARILEWVAISFSLYFYFLYISYFK